MAATLRARRNDRLWQRGADSSAADRLGVRRRGRARLVDAQHVCMQRVKLKMRGLESLGQFGPPSAEAPFARTEPNGIDRDDADAPEWARGKDDKSAE